MTRDRGPGYSPQFARQCLVRHVLRLRSDPRFAAEQNGMLKDEGETAHDWLDKYERKTKDLALRAEVVQQWGLGNRGDWGDWRHPEKAAA